jgi:hypothetical protein
VLSCTILWHIDANLTPVYAIDNAAGNIGGLIMSRVDQIGSHKTSLFTDTDGLTKVVYHSTTVIAWNDKRIILNSGGYMTTTTKTRINQASNQFALGVKVYQKNFDWFVTHRGLDFPFTDNMELKRNKEPYILTDAHDKYIATS